MQVNSQPLIKVTVLDTTHKGGNIVSNTFLTQLFQNEEIRVYLLSGQIGGFFAIIQTILLISYTNQFTE